MRVLVPAAFILGSIASLSSSLATPVATTLIKSGDAIVPGRTVTDISGVSTNAIGGFAFLATSTDSTTPLDHFWGSSTSGNGAVLRSSGSTISGYAIGSFETGFGIDNQGRFSYSPNVVTGASVTNADSEWLNDTPLAIKGDPCPASLVFPSYVPAGERWAFASSPAIASQTGEAWFVAGLTTSTTSTTSQRRALIRQSPPAAASVVLVAGQPIPGVSETISDVSSVLFAWGLSPNGSNYLVPVTLNAAAASDKLITLNGQPVVVGSGADTALFREGVTVPVSAGGSGFESWAQPSGTATIAASCSVNNSGRWIVSARLNVGLGNVLVRDGRIWRREGDAVEGQFITGSFSDVRINGAGDVSYFAGLFDGSATHKAVIFNSRIIAIVGQNVDTDWDGTPDPTSTLTDINSGGYIAQGVLAQSERLGGAVNVYFGGKVTTATGTDLPAGLVVHVCLADFNGGGLAVSDIFDFLSAWFAGDIRADFSGDGALSVGDIFDFLNAWFSGC